MSVMTSLLARPTLTATAATKLAVGEWNAYYAPTMGSASCTRPDQPAAMDLVTTCRPTHPPRPAHGSSQKSRSRLGRSESQRSGPGAWRGAVDAPGPWSGA